MSLWQNIWDEQPKEDRVLLARVSHVSTHAQLAPITCGLRKWEHHEGGPVTETCSLQGSWDAKREIEKWAWISVSLLGTVSRTWLPSTRPCPETLHLLTRHRPVTHLTHGLCRDPTCNQRHTSNWLNTVNISTFVSPGLFHMRKVNESNPFRF